QVRQNDVLENIREKEDNGQVSIYLDSLLEENYTKHLVLNSKTRGITGYRVRIFSDTGRGAKDKQKRVRAHFLSLFPDVDAYSKYEGSYYKIYVGDFRTKNEAILLLERIKKNFPDGFVVEDYIEIEE
ncbi:SPOR domain-containing protein, partial [Bacteroidota bacterium]